MTDAGQLDRRVVFLQRSADANGSRTGAFVEVVRRNARIAPLKGGESVQAARMAGQQPVIVTVRRDALTAAIDNSYRAQDARAPYGVWNVTSAILTEDRQWVELLAVEYKGGDEDEAG